MHKIDFPMDAKEQAVISRRQRVEEERKQRIFNPRERIIGKDLEALKMQIQEKRDREQREKELEAAWLRETQRQQLVLSELQKRVEEDRRKVWMDVQEFRKTCQRYEDRREFDLNDKRKQNFPARLHDEDVRNGPASMQKFEGEDLTHRGRIMSQNKQKQFWLDAQIAERKRNESEYEEVNKMYEQRLREMAFRQNELAKGERMARASVERAYRDYNRALAQEKSEQKCLEKLADEEATLAHQLNMFHSELLTEVQDATSVNGPFRVSKDKYKGFTEEQLKTIKEEQLRQAMAKKLREKEEKNYDAAWEKLHKRYAIATTILDREMECRNRDKFMEIQRLNKELACEQKLRQEYMNNVVYKGGFSAGFFDQFNTSSR